MLGDQRCVFFSSLEYPSIRAAQIARLQCAFALLLQIKLEARVAPEFVEPMLNDEETDALCKLGFSVGAGVVAEPCAGDVVYAPHAPAGLYHNELLLRWSKVMRKQKMWFLFLLYFVFLRSF